jgi:hypothetical protein
MALSGRDDEDNSGVRNCNEPVIIFDNILRGGCQASIGDWLSKGIRQRQRQRKWQRTAAAAAGEGGIIAKMAGIMAS